MKKIIWLSVVLLALASGPKLLAPVQDTKPPGSTSEPRPTQPSPEKVKPGRELPRDETFPGGTNRDVDVLLPVQSDGPLFKGPVTAAQDGDLVHVEGVPGGGAKLDGGKRLWSVKVKLASGKIVTVWFEAADKPPLQFCNWIKINKTSTDPRGNTVIEDYEKTPPPDETPPPSEPQPPTEPGPPTAPDPTPPTVPEPTPPEPPTDPLPPQPPGDKTEPERPKEEVVKPPPWAPPDMPDWLKPWWEAVKYIVPGSEFANLPDGKDALGLLIARLNKLIIDEDAKGNEKKREFYEQLKEKLQRIYHNM